ncbi:ADP-ribosylglycohydrolase family protein [uncultured Turicimonas sp.]|uniref:ADP-ribosylglycohydrolase family protein n=1 Tax=uncultured Turicimonas sp. TaxID=1918607 RepID=UPI002804558F|nr:ADP-ribosylglycohydrolase family protein [uncultured Turicimonas sp.]
MGQPRPRWEKEVWTGRHPNPLACNTCIFRATISQNILLDRADTDTCEVYKQPDRKPNDVYWDGAPCEYYEAVDDKPQALLLGLAVGDALGVPVEFKERGSFQVKGMLGYGTHNQPAGTWSDDTSLALILADNLGTEGIFWKDLARSFVEWRDKGEFTPHGKAFDIGNATNWAIIRLKKGIEPTKAGGKDERDNGNGSLMRIAPLVFYMFGKKPQERYEITKNVSSVTHAHPISITACFIYIEFLRLLSFGRSKKVAYTELRENFVYYKKFLDKSALAKFERILNGDVSTLKESEIKSTGYVVDTLEAALWSFLITRNYGEAVLKAVNLGDDTDTTGAVTGAMAGLHYGLKDIPQDWLDKLAKREFIRDIAIKMPRWDLLPSA